MPSDRAFTQMVMAKELQPALSSRPLYYFTFWTEGEELSAENGRRSILSSRDHLSQPLRKILRDDVRAALPTRTILIEKQSPSEGVVPCRVER
jgi:hypothetical protein